MTYRITQQPNVKQKSRGLSPYPSSLSIRMIKAMDWLMARQISRKQYLTRFQVDLASYDHTNVAPSCFTSPPIVDVVTGDDTELVYVITDIILKELQNSLKTHYP